MRLWLTLAALLATPAFGADDVSLCGLNISAQFDEGAPRDRFTIENASAENWTITSARLDLAPSRGGLIFDTDAGGDGVEVFQPFEGSEDSAKLGKISELTDGGKTMLLDFTTFAPGERYVFTIDVDDTAKASDLGQIRVVGGEIDGATLRFTLRSPSGEEKTTSMSFGADAKARLSGKSGC